MKQKNFLILGQTDFLATPPTLSFIKNFDKVNFIKIKNICFSKGIVKRAKRQAIDLEKIFANHIYNKGIVLRIKNSNSMIRKQTTQSKTGKRFEQIFH